MLTDTKPDEWVIYDPPKSVSFGHQARVRNARKAWKLTEEFVTRHTDFSLGHHRRLTCYGPTDMPVASLRVASAREALGPETSSEGSWTYWDLQPNQLAAAIEFVLNDGKFPKQDWPETNLSFYYQFAWKNLALPLVSNESRDVQSSLGVEVKATSVFLQPTFVFPAPWNSEIFRSLFALIESASPFRFRDQYFKRWFRPRRKGFGLVRKLDRNWRST